MPAVGTGLTWVWGARVLLPQGVWGSHCHSRVQRAMTQDTNQTSLFVFVISVGRRERGDRGASAAGPPPQHCRAAACAAPTKAVASEAAPPIGNGLGEECQGACFQ